MSGYTVRVLSEDAELVDELDTTEEEASVAYDSMIGNYIDTESPFYPGDPFYTVQCIDGSGNVLHETNSAIIATKAGRNFA